MKTTRRFTSFIQMAVWFVAIIATVATGSARQRSTQGKHDLPPQKHGQNLLQPKQHHSPTLAGNLHRIRPGYRSLAVDASTAIPDPAFGARGKVTTDFGDDDCAYAVSLQTDGKIVAAGYSRGGSKDVFALARYNNDGSLDGTFGTGGKVTTTIGDAARVYAISLQSDGKIVAAGYSTIGGNNVFALARYKSDGSLDSTFGTDGKVTTSIGADNDEACAVSLQTDGKIVAAGYSFVGNRFVFALIRYNNDGSLDSTFDSDGIVTTAIGSKHNWAYAVSIQTDGKIVAAGYSNDAGRMVYALARYDSSGSLASC